MPALCSRLLRAFVAAFSLSATLCAVPQLQLELGQSVSWPTVLGNTYQLQSGTSGGTTWSNLGASLNGDANTHSTYAQGRDPARTFQVLETYPVLVTAPAVLTNGSFETAGASAAAAANWDTLASQPPVRITTDARTGTASIRAKLLNIGSSPAEGILQQVLLPAGSAITPGQSYVFTFWAKQVSSGPSYIQQYWLQWLNSSGGTIGGTGLQNFSATTGTWTKITASTQVAPAGTAGVKIVFRLVTGAVSGGLGEVLLDDIDVSPLNSAPTVASTATRTLAPTTSPAGQLTWPSTAGVRYTAQKSSDLATWTDFGPELTGNGSPLAVTVPLTLAAEFFRLRLADVVVAAPSNLRVITSNQANAIGIAWDASTSAGITGYRIFYGLSGGPLDQSIDVGNVTSAIIPDLVQGNTYGFSVATLAFGTVSPVAAGTFTGQPEAGLGLDPLFGAATPLEQEILFETSDALVTRLADRVRARHARESQFQRYDLYLTHYWEQRILRMEILDKVAKGGTQLVFNYTTLAPLSAAEFRAFHSGRTTSAEYHFNAIAPLISSAPSVLYPGETEYNYSMTLVNQLPENRPLRVGDRVELELSQFFSTVRNGQLNYYGTTLLYMVGEGIVPWYDEVEYISGGALDSRRMPEKGWLGGLATLPYHYSNEPQHRFKQMSGNMAPVSGVPFMLGRRLHHTDFRNGAHSESGNPIFTTHAGKAGPKFITGSCIDCHINNGRGLPPAVGMPLTTSVVKVGSDAAGSPHPLLGETIQGQNLGGAPEAEAVLASYTELPGTYGDGAPFSLRRPNYSFTGVTPQFFSVRIAPQLVGLGLLEAVPELTLLEKADPSDSDGDGISGRMQLIHDPVDDTKLRLGRFTLKGAQDTVKHQIAYALNRDMGVTTSVFPILDGETVPQNPPEINNTELDQLNRYVSLLGIAARRSLIDPIALRGEEVFQNLGCVACHTPTLRTGSYHPFAEFRNQTIRPYTDLMLHDMGSGLADNMGEEGASGAEWRTAPLWNIGLTAGVSGGEAYLHDGRARTLEEAILWHGGEGEAAKEAFRTAPASDRAALVKFLKSL
jgi:CxxC motif-containing protein (DUF1111 family)